MLMGRKICGAVIQFGCCQHRHIVNVLCITALSLELCIIHCNIATKLWLIMKGACIKWQIKQYCVRVRECVCSCVHVLMHAFMRACMCMCVYVCICW